MNDAITSPLPTSPTSLCASPPTSLCAKSQSLEISSSLTPPAQDNSGSGLHVRNATVHYGTKVAVDNVSLDVLPGEIVALLGPSGCGKSSLLRAIVGLEPLASGSIAYDKADLAGVPVHKRGFGLLFQDGQLFPHRDVARNIAYGLEGGQMLKPERAARVAELLELVGLVGFERRAVATLSGGERQRVALARSLAPRPRLLLLDEPFSALDRALRERLAVEVRDILRATGTTAILVTHDHDEALTVADRIVLMNDARLTNPATHPMNREFVTSETFQKLQTSGSALPRSGRGDEISCCPHREQEG